MTFRRTTQTLMPARRERPAPAGYDLYPTFALESGTVHLGFEALAARLSGERTIILDGATGVMWEDFRTRLDTELRHLGLEPVWTNITAAHKAPEDIEALVQPFLGDDPVFGTRFTGSLLDFFERDRLAAFQPDSNADINLLYGVGASLAGWAGLLGYLELPRNELQFRARAGLPTNLAAPTPLEPKAAYKRSYFVDWTVLNAHKANILERIDLLVDTQRPDEPSFIGGSNLRTALTQMSRRPIRARPWFEPGVWGGQRIKQLVSELPQDAPNYAWSFELITPENGLLLESDGVRLEVGFETLMFHAHEAVLGEAAGRFGFEFPIRFDWLDTIKGGNLSLQCHPRPAYIRQHFGEQFTQDETYYILEAEPEATVYLGFQAGIDPLEFRGELVRSQMHHAPLDIERFVRRHRAAQHDLFLIPNGAVHCSGEGSLVLEISATPYIFTFKMYDWLRLDLDGKPRPLNIERALENLRFEYAGETVRETLIAKPTLLQRGDGWRIVHLPTHEAHFYDVHRLEFSDSLEVAANGQCHVLALVEGASLMIETSGGARTRYHYAETFIVPAAAGSYRLVNEGSSEAKVIQAFVKPERS